MYLFLTRVTTRMTVLMRIGPSAVRLEQLRFRSKKAVKSGCWTTGKLLIGTARISKRNARPPDRQEGRDPAGANGPPRRGSRLTSQTRKGATVLRVLGPLAERFAAPLR